MARLRSRYANLAPPLRGEQLSQLPCPHSTCGGTLRADSLEEVNARNYYYQVVRKTMIPMRVEEHTAELDPEKGRAYQDYFKRGEINVLSCSTTFEMGIDPGDLQAVMRRVFGRCFMAAQSV